DGPAGSDASGPGTGAENVGTTGGSYSGGGRSGGSFRAPQPSNTAPQISARARIIAARSRERASRSTTHRQAQTRAARPVPRRERHRAVNGNAASGAARGSSEQRPSLP